MGVCLVPPCWNLRLFYREIGLFFLSGGKRGFGRDIDELCRHWRCGACGHCCPSTIYACIPGPLMIHATLIRFHPWDVPVLL